MLDKEFKYYLDHQQEFAKKWDQRFIVIIGEKVVGDYPSEIEAYLETQNEHQLGTFLIQKCGTEEGNHMMTVHTLY